jgi:DNA-directed RNA polymerase I, II, and III subunit RPABC1
MSNIELNSKEVNNTILENVLKLLERRKMISSWKKEYKDINNENKFDLILDDKTRCNIYIYNSKITNIAQSTPLDDYLSNNTDMKKFLVCKEFSKKVYKQINNEYKNAEVFNEVEMLEDIISNVLVSDHKILAIEEKKELLNKFSENELGKIYSTDMMSRYYGAKIGDIFKITRASLTAGKNIFYRRVVNGTLEVLLTS